MLDIINVITVIILTTAVAAYWYIKSRSKPKIPKKWNPVGTVKQLYIYPLKGGRRVEIDSAFCTSLGFIMPEHDHLYRLRDRNIIMYTEKTGEHSSEPKAQLIQVKAYDANHFTLSAPDMPSLKVKIPDSSKLGRMKFWTSEIINKLDCGDAAAKWVSSFVLEKDSGIRLGFYDSGFKRDIQEGYKKCLKNFPMLKNKAAGLFSNLSSYMVMSQASVDDLAKKIPKENITVNNFRPNILVEDKNLLPYEEDNWKWLKIGNVLLYYAKPCLRCQITTVNPETGVPAKNQEPLRTLRKYRKLRDVMNIEYEGLKVVMGAQMGLEHEGKIKIGDTVFVGDD